MADQPRIPIARQSDDDLGAALRALAADVAWPVAAATAGQSDLAARVRARLEASAPPATLAPERPRLSPWHWASARRALILAIVGLLALAAIAGAAGLGLPGLRIIFGGPSAAPPGPTASATPAATSAGAGASGPGRTSVTPAPLGTDLHLGQTVDPATLDAEAGFAVKEPADPSVGAPDTLWVDPTRNDQVSLVWASSAHLPATTEPGIGLILTAFRGAVDDAWYTKALGPGTTISPVTVNGQRGYWVSGDPHQFFYEGPAGFIEESRRWVGDVLLWTDGTITYRLETSLGRDAAIAIADSMP